MNRKVRLEASILFRGYHHCIMSAILYTVSIVGVCRSAESEVTPQGP